ncbi:hypothetical protein ATL31_0395 [Phycicoccus duodecadis]|uniref:Uncharacterized protein n=2 Tax=Phycicoccus duodecadis TaxID=173053 RepID=A0A2N3YFH5_9MICO|nr:hypothetical protein ATL31_0395 [Phycicoccus duodecadis]
MVASSVVRDTLEGVRRMTRPDVLAIECRTCPVRELHCADCMVPVLLEITTRASETSLDAEERAAVTRLVRAGLVDPETATAARARLEPGSTGTGWGLAVG